MAKLPDLGAAPAQLGASLFSKYGKGGPVGVTRRPDFFGIARTYFNLEAQAQAEAQIALEAQAMAIGSQGETP